MTSNFDHRHIRRAFSRSDASYDAAFVQTFKAVGAT